MCSVTVVISNYNYQNYVGSAIESCLSQTVPCKIIVVDDASTDGSWDVIRRYRGKNTQFARLNHNSQGNARGKNVGICLANTQYITCLDSDDMLLPSSLESRIPFLDSFDFVHGRAVHLSTVLPYNKIETKYIAKHSPPSGVRKICAKIAKINSRGGGTLWAQGIEASTVLCHKNMYDRFGLYDEEMKWKIDREMWWRWLSLGASRKYLEKYVSIYRKHGASITHRATDKLPKLRSKMMKEKRKIREILTHENTMFPSDYEKDKHIGEII